jgi:hypothetical protein
MFIQIKRNEYGTITDTVCISGRFNGAYMLL